MTKRYSGNIIQGWKTESELEWMFEFAKRMSSVAEIGCWKGKGTHALLSGCRGTVTAIDPFDPANYGSSIKLANGDILEQFKYNLAAFSNLRIEQTTSEEFLIRHPRQKFDLVFLDGVKDYDGYVAELKRWLPKTKRVIAGYDYRNEEPVYVQKAVEDVIGKVNVLGAIWWKIL